jgi:phage/plasmid-associated DNA primase
MYKLYNLKNYLVKNDEIGEYEEEYDLESVIGLLEENHGYHSRIDPEKSYKIFGDIDGYTGNIIELITTIIDFFKDKYELTVIKFSYTENSGKKGSYHFVLPDYHTNCLKIKTIIINLRNYLLENNIISKDNILDTTIYSKHWFRYPNQMKESKKGTEHKIIMGEMKDFIMEYLDNSINIDDKEYIDDTIFTKDVTSTDTLKKKVIIKKKENIDNQMILYKEPDNDEIYKRFFDECYTDKRFNEYQYWITVGMGIKNRYNEQGIDLFHYFSLKGSNYVSYDDVKKKYEKLMMDHLNPITIKTLYYYAKEDNKELFSKIIREYSYLKEFNLYPTDVAQYIKILKPNFFVWKDKELYCFNGKFWEKDDLILRQYISGELYDFLKEILINCFWDHKDFGQFRTKLNKLKTISYKKEIIETTREYFTDNTVEFDHKWWLFGFTNQVYDLEKHEFRDYHFEDRISITTGYDWIEPDDTTIKTMNDIIDKIMPVKDERDLLLEILSTGLEGRCLENFIIFNGNGRNGKGVIDDIVLKALGNYGLTANNSILFEKNKTGSNPEKNNLHKKRFVIFREPAHTSKFENSVVKEITGGGKISVRGHHESNTEKVLHNTTIVECNKKPVFSEEPTNAEAERIIDILFRSTFVPQDEDFDEDDSYIFKGDKQLKTEIFQETHKYALISILINHYKIYKENNYNFHISQSVKERSRAYLEESCDLYVWFKENYEKTEDKNDIVKFKDAYDYFKTTEYYLNLSKQDKRMLNYQKFVEYFKTNLYTKKYYKDKTNTYNKILLYFKQKISNNDCII